MNTTGTGDRGPGARESAAQGCPDNTNGPTAERAHDPVGTNSRLKRLRWRCHRGTRELDAMLSGWLDRHAADADPATLQVFDALLEQQDPVLWDWLLGHAAPDREDWRAIVTEIRAHAGLGA